VGVRIVSPDRPGIGRSTFQPGRSILDWPADVAALMSHLDVDRLSVVGVSASTPYALACGVVLADTIDVVGVIAGTVPPDEELDGLASLARTDPDAARAEIERHVQSVADDIPASIRRVGDRPDPDGPLYRQPEVQAALLAATRETYRQGTEGAAYDMLLRVLPWGFELTDVRRPCMWWHGEADAVVPAKLVERATAGTPQHFLTVIPGVGHGVCMTHVEPFLRALLQGVAMNWRPAGEGVRATPGA
jgi:pimeloyl-ACP methyl ester carboxylesterase